MNATPRPAKLTVSQRRWRRWLRRGLRWGLAAAVIAALMAADRAGLFGRAEPPDPTRYDGKSFRVVKVVDGDTLDIDSPDGRRASTRVRLLGVDTPETVRPDWPVEHFGPEATRFVREAAAGRDVRIELDRLRTRDGYGRLVGYVILPDGTNLNLRIVATGHGYADPRFRHPLQRDFRRAQARAREDRIGLWRELTAEKLPARFRGRIRLPAPEGPASRGR